LLLLSSASGAVLDVSVDGFVKNPISALRIIPQPQRRTGSTPHSSGFARLELGFFTKSSLWRTFKEVLFPLWERRLSSAEAGDSSRDP
jgi:hypothetical protein